ncbi:MAG: sigma-70 family RNA polymerase sigma factor [Caulobacteraceae bacterium]|nr:sigma-70 family RNA polymerase sigma factor [Caulobacteraceae bacterium]
MLGRLSVTGGDRGPARPGGRDDAELLALIAQKDFRAFEALYRAYHPRLSRFLINILRRPHLVEEVLNDALMVVWRQAERYNGRSKVSTWIFAIAYRKALKALRRQDEPVEDKDAEFRPSGEAGPEQQLDRRQVQERLLSAINELSTAQRAVVDLTYFHELGYREIAELMDCPVDTVKTRMFHARRHLKNKLPGRLADWL